MPAQTSQNIQSKRRFAHSLWPQIKAESILYDYLCPIIRSPTVGCRKAVSFSLCKEQALWGVSGACSVGLASWLRTEEEQCFLLSWGHHVSQQGTINLRKDTSVVRNHSWCPPSPVCYNKEDQQKPWSNSHLSGYGKTGRIVACPKQSSFSAALRQHV